MRHLAVASLLAAMNVGCGSAVLSAASSGDLDTFRAELKARLAEGDVSVGEAQDIAQALTDHEIETAQGDNGVRAVEAVAECREHFDGALSTRAGAEDDVAAHATLVRQDAGKVSPMNHLDKLDSDDDPWRAVAARSLVYPEPAPGGGVNEEYVTAARWRRKLMADRASLVRMSALRSAIDAADRGDAEDVLAAARLDPDPDVRFVAIEAAGRIGTRETVLGLKDVWNDIDHEGKLAIVAAWAEAWRRPYLEGDEVKCQPLDLHPSCEAWGQLQRISDEGNGMPALLASLELIHDVSPAEAKVTEGNAAAVVERLIDKAAPRVRIEAIESAPLGWAHLLEAIVAAAKDNEDVVVVAALSRMLEVGDKERADALTKLKKLVSQKGAVGEAAALALARAGDKAAVARLEKEAKSASREQRIKAARAFAEMGDAAHALALLGDASVEVRTATSCAIMGMDD
jgi:hypothetical protein